MKSSQISNKHLRQFVRHVEKIAERHLVDVRFVPRQHVVTDEGLSVSGYFQSEPAQLVVAVGRPECEWALILAHEYNHMRQWIRRTVAWRRSISSSGVDVTLLVDLWLSHMCELNEEQKARFFLRTVAVELECEKMTVQLLRRHAAFSGTDIREYIQKSNAYLFFYQHVARSRRWYPAHHGPSEQPKIWREMPTRFQSLKGYQNPSRFFAGLYRSVYG